MLWRGYDSSISNASRYDNDVMGASWWRVQTTEVSLLLSKLSELRILSFHSILFDDTFALDYGSRSNGGNNTVKPAKLRGLALIGCNYGDTFFRVVTGSGTLRYLDIVAIGNEISHCIPSFDESGTLGASEIISIAGEHCPNLTSFSLIGTGVMDHDLKSIGSYFKKLNRLALGDCCTRITEGGLGFLKSKFLNQLVGISLLNGRSPDDSSEIDDEHWSRADTKDSTSKKRGEIGDATLRLFDDSCQLSEMDIMGLNVSPAGVSGALGKLKDLKVSDCYGFDNAEEVCRLCRSNPSLVIRTLDDKVLEEGVFRSAFFDCERGEGQDDDEEVEGEGEGEDEDEDEDEDKERKDV